MRWLMVWVSPCLSFREQVTWTNALEMRGGSVSSLALWASATSIAQVFAIPPASWTQNDGDFWIDRFEATR